jgi:uncharacterized membrane protein (UPF0127 family)
MSIRNNLRAGAAAVAALAALGGGPAFAATCPAPQETANPVPVHVRAPAATLALRVAADEATREYGLMCVRALPANSGMLFVFDDGDQRRAFWMKNTLIPLDMIFVRKDGTVNNVDANVPATTVDTPAERLTDYYGTGAYVIELGAGGAVRAGIVPGTQLDLSAIGPR